MLKNQLVLFILLMLISMSSWSQISITGRVLDEEGRGISGVMVIEKGTDNTTKTDLEGKYIIEIADSTSSLYFTFVGMMDREVLVNGQSEINTFLKPYTIYEAWDQKMGFYLNSGIINTPVGARFDFSIPLLKSPISLQTVIDYQTDFLYNQLIDGSLRMNHIRFTNNIGLSLIGNARNIFTNNDYNHYYYSLEANWSFYGYGFIAGVSHLDMSTKDSDELSEFGFITGLEFWLPKPFKLEIIGKVGIYNELTEYYIEAYKDFEVLNTFVRYYNTKFYSEVTVGVGLELTYYFRYQKNSNTYAID